MDYAAAIERIYEHLEHDRANQAVMSCLRIARNLQDYLFIAVFLREMHPVGRDFIRMIFDDISHLKDDAREYIDKRSLEYWRDLHTLDFDLAVGEDDEKKNVLAIGVGEIDPRLEQCERSIADLATPCGMNEYDTAAFADQNARLKGFIRLQIRALQIVKQRINTRCLDYASRIERQMLAQSKSQGFLEQCQNEVNNYFKAHSEEVYIKLQKAAQLVDSNDPEDFSLLLTQVRRAIKAVADYFYPATNGLARCSDGEERNLGDEQYLNRLTEYLATTFEKSSSRDSLCAELNLLAVFARRLNKVASKGVHAEVSAREAKQGLIGLYMFLFNVTSRLQEKSSQE